MKGSLRKAWEIGSKTNETIIKYLSKTNNVFCGAGEVLSFNVGFSYIGEIHIASTIRIHLESDGLWLRFGLKGLILNHIKYGSLPLNKLFKYKNPFNISTLCAADC